MKLLFAILCTLVLSLLCPTAHAQQQKCAEQTKPLEVTDVPVRHNSNGILAFYQTELCPPAAAENERWFLIWRPSELDAQRNQAIVRATPEIITALWIDPKLGQVGYFNLAFTDLWMLTLVDVHTYHYHTYMIDTSDPRMKVEWSNSTPIPLPRNLRSDH